VPLLKADKTAAQIVTFGGSAVYTEKSGGIAELNLSTHGMPGLSGPNVPIQLPPRPTTIPLSVWWYGAPISTSPSHIRIWRRSCSTARLRPPCWNALSGQFLFAADSPGKQLLRYLVSDAHIFFDKPGVAVLAGSPTGLDIQGGLPGVIDGGDGTNSNASLFDVDSEGELTLRLAT
jgi:hypothetical protein